MVRIFSFEASLVIYIKGKGHPATGRGAPRGSGYVKAPEFLDVRHYKSDSSSALRTGRLYLRSNPWYSFSEAKTTPGHMAQSEATEKSPVTPPGIDPGTSQLIVQCLNHYANPGPLLYIQTVKIFLQL